MKMAEIQKVLRSAKHELETARYAYTSLDHRIVGLSDSVEILIAAVVGIAERIEKLELKEQPNG